MFGFAYRCAGAEFLFFMLKGRANECGEEWVRLQRLGFEFWMELAAEEPRVVRGLDNFHVILVGRAAGDAQSRGDQGFLDVAIEVVAGAVGLPAFHFAAIFLVGTSGLLLS